MAKRFSKETESAAVAEASAVEVKYRNISSTSLPLDSGAVFKPGDERFLTDAEISRFTKLEQTSKRRYIAAVELPSPVAPKVIPKLQPPPFDIPKEGGKS